VIRVSWSEPVDSALSSRKSTELEKEPSITSNRESNDDESVIYSEELKFSSKSNRESTEELNVVSSVFTLPSID